MRKFAYVLAIACAAAAAMPALVVAGPAADALGICLADNTSGKERKTLARWIFVAISSHPAINDVSAVTATMRDDADREMAALVMKLLSESCPGETAQAVSAEGPKSLESAFESLGKLAMVELMSNPAVESSIVSYVKYLDSPRLEMIMKKRSVE